MNETRAPDRNTTTRKRGPDQSPPRAGQRSGDSVPGEPPPLPDPDAAIDLDLARDRAS